MLNRRVFSAGLAVGVLGSRANAAQGAVFASRAAAIAAHIPLQTPTIVLEGWARPGDGGEGVFVLMAGDTALLTPPEAVSMRRWHLQSADGSWWLRTTLGPVNFQMFGARGSGYDDTQAIQDALDYHPKIYGKQPTVLMLPDTHTISKTISSSAASPYLTTGFGSDDLVTFTRAAFSGHTFEFGDITTSCQRLVFEGALFRVASDGHWVDGAGKRTNDYWEGAIVLSTTMLPDRSTLVRLDRQHELTHGNLVNFTSTGVASYDGKNFLVHVSDPTSIILLNLDSTRATGLPLISGGSPGVVKGPKCCKVLVDATPSAKIAAVTRANPCVVTFASHVFVQGDTLAFSDVGGITQLNNNGYSVAAVHGNSVTLSKLGGGSLDSTGFSKHTSGGAAAVPAQGAVSYATATLDNLVSSSHYHIMAWYPTRGRFSRIQGIRTGALICAISDSYQLYDQVSGGGIWDQHRAGLQETLASIYLPFPTGVAGIRTLPTIRNPGLLSTGTAELPRLIRRGNGAFVQRFDTCGRDGIYCEQAEGIEITGEYLGGYNRSCIHFKAMGILVHVKVHHIFLDGGAGDQIRFELGKSAVWNVMIDHVDTNGGYEADSFLKIDDGTGVLPIPHVNSLDVDHVIGQGFLSSVMILLGADTAEIGGNILTGYNLCGDTSGDPILCSGIYTGPNAGRINVRGGTYGGGINQTALGDNNCKWGVFAAAIGTTTAADVKAGFIGQRGGGLLNVNVAKA